MIFAREAEDVKNRTLLSWGLKGGNRIVQKNIDFCRPQAKVLASPLTAAFIGDDAPNILKYFIELFYLRTILNAFRQDNTTYHSSPCAHLEDASVEAIHKALGNLRFNILWIQEESTLTSKQPVLASGSTLGKFGSLQTILELPRLPKLVSQWLQLCDVQTKTFSFAVFLLNFFIPSLLLQHTKIYTYRWYTILGHTTQKTESQRNKHDIKFLQLYTSRSYKNRRNDLLRPESEDASKSERNGGDNSKHVLSPKLVNAIANTAQVVWANCQEREGLLGRSDMRLQTAVGMPVAMDSNGNMCIVVMFSPKNVQSNEDAVEYLKSLSQGATSTSIPCLLPVMDRNTKRLEYNTKRFMDWEENDGEKKKSNSDASNSLVLTDVSLWIFICSCTSLCPLCLIEMNLMYAQLIEF